MKTRFNNRFSLLQVMLVIAVIGLFAAFVIPKASAQVTPTTISNIVGWPSQITTAVASNVNAVITVRQGKVMQFQWAFAANNTTTDSLIIWYQPSADGTNYQTRERIFSTAANGTTVVVGDGKIAATDSEGWKTIKITVVSNASARTFITTNAIVAWRN